MRIDLYNYTNDNDTIIIGLSIDHNLFYLCIITN